MKWLNKDKRIKLELNKENLEDLKIGVLNFLFYNNKKELRVEIELKKEMEKEND